MPLFSDDGLILHSFPFRERHQVLTALTSEHGVIRGVFRSARGGRTPAAAATQILSLVRLSVFDSQRSELATIRQAELLQSSYPLAQDISAASGAAVVAELLATFTPPAQPAQLAFRLGRSALQGLLEGVAPVTAIAFVEYWVLTLDGVLPPLDECSACGSRLEGGFSVREGDSAPQCHRCSPAATPTVDRDGLAFLLSCRRTPLTEMRQPVPRSAARWLDASVRREAERPLRALDFFRRHADTAS